MAETSTQSRTATAEFGGTVEGTRRLLRAVYGVFPIVAGADKFTNLLATWPELLPGAMVEVLPVEPQLFMYLVGAVEIVAGLVVLWRSEYGGYLVAAWLVAIAATQVVAGNYDVAVRDVWIAVGAVALARLTAARGVS